MVVLKSFCSLIYHLDNTFIRFDTRFYRQILGFPTRLNYAHLCAADFFYHVYERETSYVISDENQANIFKLSILLLHFMHRCHVHGYCTTSYFLIHVLEMTTLKTTQEV